MCSYLLVGACIPCKSSDGGHTLRAAATAAAPPPAQAYHCWLLGLGLRLVLLLVLVSLLRLGGSQPSVPGGEREGKGISTQVATIQENASIHLHNHACIYIAFECECCVCVLFSF